MVSCSSWASSRPVDGPSVYVPPLWGTVSELADVSQQPCRWHRGDRTLYLANGRVPDSLLSCHPAPRTTILGLVWCDIKSDRGVDLASDYRGVPVGPCTSIPHQGSGRVVWIGLRAASVRYGHSRPADRPRDHPGKMLALRDSLARSAGSAWTTSSCSVKRTCAGS